MRVDFLTIFPGLVKGVLEYGLILQSREKGLLDLEVHDLRDYSKDRHRSIDDVPYGGGPGMVFKPEPVFEAVEAIRGQDSKVVFPSPQGQLFTQELAQELSSASHLIFVCARYEGVDERICEALVDYEVSIGDFVTMGGELPSLLMLETIARFVPGVVGDRDSVLQDSFQESILDCPHYTRPEEYLGRKVPEVLLSGHHERIRLWRRRMALKRTLERRPDLLERLHLSDEDLRLLQEIRGEKDVIAE